MPKQPPSIGATSRSSEAEPVTAGYALALLEHLRARGIEPSTLYPETFVSELESPQAPSMLSLDQWLSMIDAAVATTGDADLALKVGMGMKTRHLGLLGYVVMSCATLRDVLNQVVRYTRLVGYLNTTQLIHRGRNVELSWRWPHDSEAPPAVSQVQLASRIASMRWLTDTPQLTAAAHFQFKRPRDVAQYDRYFGEAARFDQGETKLVFREEYLNLRIVTSHPEMQKLMAMQAEAALEAAGAPSFLRELKAALISGLSTGRTSISASAQSLNTSVRTLQRKLDEHGCTHRDVVDDVRRQQAMQYLRDPRTSLTQVAFLLGYSQQSAFHTAFKRWTGVTPKDFRASKAASEPPRGKR